MMLCCWVFMNDYLRIVDICLFMLCIVSVSGKLNVGMLKIGLCGFFIIMVKLLFIVCGIYF